jgi:hypothetical protein
MLTALLLEIRDLIVQRLPVVLPYAFSCATALADVARAKRLPSQRVPRQWIDILTTSNNSRLGVFLDALVEDGIVNGRLFCLGVNYQRSSAMPVVGRWVVFVHYNAETHMLFEFADHHAVYNKYVNGILSWMPRQERRLPPPPGISFLRSPEYTDEGILRVDCTHCLGR